MSLPSSLATALPPGGPPLPGAFGVLVPLQLFSGEFLYYALVSFVVALVAALVGLRGAPGIGVEIARISVLLFVVLAVVTLSL